MAIPTHNHDEVKTASWEEKAINYFQSKGVRWTPQRQLILAALESNRGHVSAEEIYQEVIRTFPRVNISTVYRTLELLSEMGLLVKVPNQLEDRDRFELVTEKLHHHLVCKNCGGELELDGAAIEELKESALKKYGFALELNHFVGYGLCKECLAEAAE